MAGAELSYQYSDNDQYTITYTLYTDCSGSLPPSSVNLSVRSESCSLTKFITLAKVPDSEIEISTNCTSAPSTCNGGNAIGYKQIKYESTISLVEKCSDLILSVTDCCRNSAINSILNPETQPLYVETRLNNTIGPNNSPVFNSKPILFLNANQVNHLSENATDIDNDSLVYSLIAPKTSELTNVNFASGYSAEQFIGAGNPIEFNTQTGSIKLTPSRIETGILAVLVSEYRAGQLIGSVMRDIQLISMNSTNHIPSIQQLEALSNSEIKLCVGQDLILNMSSVDPDAGQQTHIDISTNITGLSILKSSDNLQKAQVKWKADSISSLQSDLWIKVIITDNACPWNGVNTYLLKIEVSNLNVTGSVINSDCNGKNNGSISLSTTGSSAISFNWLNSGINRSAIENLSAGIYNVVVSDESGCVISKTFQVFNTETLTAEITTERSDCGISNGQAEIVITGGTSPYRLDWNDHESGFSRKNLKAGNYSVEISDQIGCKISSLVSIESEKCNTEPSEIKLYPNPAVDRIIIHTNKPEYGIQSILISDASGRIVMNRSLEWTEPNEAEINVSELSKGIYIVRIVTPEKQTMIPFVKL